MAKTKKEGDAIPLTPQYSSGQGVTLVPGKGGETSNVPQMDNQGLVEGPTGGKTIPDALGYAGGPISDKSKK